MCVWKWKGRERETGGCACEWLLFSSGLIYLAQMYSLPLSMPLYKPMSMHECVCAYACVWAHLISLATQLEGTLSHAEHNAEETADRLPVAFLLYARMIWIQPDVMVKVARRIWYHDLLWKYAELGKRYPKCSFFSVMLNSDPMVFIGLKLSFHTHKRSWRE